MNYEQIKQNIISLGFAEKSDYEEFEDLGYTYDAITRAIRVINTRFPYIAKYEFDIDGSDEGILYVDMADRPGFLGLAETPVLFEKDGEGVFQQFTDYEIEMERTLVINAENKGSYRIYYHKDCTDITPETMDTFIPEIPLKAHHLIPLLASYFLWLDDEPAKAAQYYNLYETELASIEQKNSSPRIKVIANSEWGVI